MNRGRIPRQRRGHRFGPGWQSGHGRHGERRGRIALPHCITDHPDENREENCLESQPLHAALDGGSAVVFMPLPPFAGRNRRKGIIDSRWKGAGIVLVCPCSWTASRTICATLRGRLPLECRAKRGASMSGEACIRARRVERSCSRRGKLPARLVEIEDKLVGRSGGQFRQPQVHEGAQAGAPHQRVAHQGMTGTPIQKESKLVVWPL